ncbi:Transcriptional regulator containing an amidase domain and an AraC-type DNA-binding HTH domain [Variovorax sp. HW608]|uniref:helix-turn-helix domain-containing protein n=1 Tax=Variovorax sp. HW608 TaxID=1034889 RepID=UPI0008200A05|nr:AraC family transcriptional regulator [Variovorax sp. HW608]SCK10192.1 Transcriptional regulator containing an amidase domain and an AraC-type DNA-binding HTH domain [Variovorax sp. HW608]
MEVESRWVHYADFCRASPYAVFPQEHRYSEGRLAFHMMTIDQADHDFVDPSVPETVIALPIEVASGSTWSWDMGKGWHRESARPGRMLALPEETESRWEVKGKRKLLLLAVPRRTVQRILSADSATNVEEAFRPLSLESWEDPLAQGLMLRIWEALAGSHRIDQLLVDGALMTIIAHLVQRAGGAQPAERSVALPSWRLKRVCEYVDAHLSEDLDVETLAELAGLSVRHFSRAFTRQLGQTPHRWLMSRRTERALELLADEHMSLAHVADSCGFANQSHLTKVLKQETGYTPKRLRHLPPERSGAVSH